MKKFLIGLFVSLLLVCPFYSVSALEYSDVFEIGDDVTVSFDNGTTKYGFHVIKASAAGESNVLLLSDNQIAVHDASGNIVNGGGQVVYQLPDATGDASIFEGSNAQSMLNKAVNELSWIVVGSPRFLETSDFNTLGINRDSDGTYTIPVKYDFLAPNEFESAPAATTTDYWTQIAKDTNNVYAVVKEGANKNNGISAKVVAYNVDPVTSNSKFSMRPVVLVDKKYILCNNTRQSNPENPQPTTEPEKLPENTETGVSDYILLLVGIGCLTTIGYVGIKKKNLFKEI